MLGIINDLIAEALITCASVRLFFGVRLVTYSNMSTADNDQDLAKMNPCFGEVLMLRGRFAAHCGITVVVTSPLLVSLRLLSWCIGCSFRCECDDTIVERTRVLTASAHAYIDRLARKLGCWCPAVTLKSTLTCAFLLATFSPPNILGGPRNCLACPPMYQQPP